MGDIEVKELTGKVEFPPVMKGASAHQKVHIASEKLMKKLGFPEKKLPNWKEKALEEFERLLKKYRSLYLYMDICVKCGACTDKCQFFIGTQDPNNMPVARAELMRKVYRKYFTTEGKLLGPLARAQAFDDKLLDDWITYFHQCSECRRCSVFCPYGIDQAEITMAAREIMNSVGVGNKYTVEIIGKVHDIGNNLGIPEDALEGTLEFMEEDIMDETGHEVKLPLNQEGVDVLMVPPSADFFSSPHVESLGGYAKVFHQAGISYTFSSYASEAANFGLFVGNYKQMQIINKRIWDEARRLKVKRVVIGECGHAWRALYAFSDTLNGPFDFLDRNYPIPQHICEFTYDLYKKGALKFNKEENDEFIVTYHDSCNVARGSRMGNYPRGQYEIPREIIKACCNKFVDMPEWGIREKTFCCGGGGGLLSEELMDLRIKGALPRLQGLKAVMDSHDVNFIALICSICKAQMTKVFPYYDLDMEMVGGVHQLVSRAIELGAKEGI
jgi:Fe-S oxidoreductase